MTAPARHLTCRELVRFLDGHLDRTLATDQQLALDVHVGACGACRAYLETYATTVRLVRGAFRAWSPSSEPPDALVRDILDARPRLRLVRGERPR